MKSHHQQRIKLKRKQARPVLMACVSSTEVSIETKASQTCQLAHEGTWLLILGKKALGQTYVRLPRHFPRKERLTEGGAILPHDALHRGDDLLHHRW